MYTVFKFLKTSLSVWKNGRQCLSALQKALSECDRCLTLTT